MINFFNTHINQKAFEGVSDVLKSTFLSEGKLVKEFEAKLADVLKCSYPVAVNSGTSSLHLALVLAGVKENDEVILAPQTFVATGLAILYQRAKPIFVDINYEDGNINPEVIEAAITEKTKAIIVVHWGGYPCDMDPILDIAHRHNLKVIEDAAHAPGAQYKNKAIGSISDFTCFSFQAIKHITTGDGGAVCVREADLLDKAMALRWFGIDRNNSLPSILGERIYDISEYGFKYHMNDYAASLGLANLIDFQERLNRRAEIAKQYNDELSKIKGITLFKKAEDRSSANWLYGFHVENRENFILALKNREVPSSVVHLGIDKNSVFGGKRDDLINQRKFDATQINIPMHDGLTNEQVSYIIDSIKLGW